MSARKRTHLFPMTTAALVTIFHFAFVSSTALSALELPPPPAPAVHAIQGIEDGGLWLMKGGTIDPERGFVCMAESADASPPCEQNADGTWDCWGELTSLGWNLVTCAVGVGIPAFKAWRAADAAYDVFLAAKAASKAKKAQGLAATSGAGAAVSAAYSAIVAILGDIMCLYLADAIQALWDCIFA